MLRFILITLGLLPLWGYAQPLQLKYGVNQQDLNADGVPDLIIRTRWDNQNAHSYDRYLVALQRGNEWLEVPLENARESAFATAEGADCITADDMALHVGYRFYLHHGMLEITRFTREWVEPRDDYPVVKTIFRLEPGEVGLPGQTPFYFKKLKAEKLKQRFCDVRDVIE